MIRTLQSNFTGGILSKDAVERLDMPIWKNGVGDMENMRIRPQGGATRRPGFAFVENNPIYHFSDGISYQIEPFIFSDNQSYVMVFTGGNIGVWDRNTRAYVQDIGTAWPDFLIQNNELSVVQAYDTMLVFHRDYDPRRIYRSPGGAFVNDQLIWSMFTDEIQTCRRPPMHKYAAGHVTAWTDGPSNSTMTGTIHVTLSDPIFQSGHWGTWFNLKGHMIYLVNILDAQNALGVLQSTAIPDWETHTINWQEQAFSVVRGWPRCGCLHQQRLWLGGGRDVPNIMWGSTTYDPFNFFLGTGQPTDAIKYQAASDHVAEIRRLQSYTHLQVFASDAEYFVPTAEGAAITPGTMSLRQQSGFGIASAPAVRFDQTTIWISRTSNTIREFIYDGQQTNYASDALTFMASDVVNAPLSLDCALETDFAQESLAIATNYNGILGVLSKVRKENAGAWMKWRTAGHVKSIGVVNREIWAIVSRQYPGGAWRPSLEVMDTNLRLDFSVLKVAGVPNTGWISLPHANMTIEMRSGDLYLGTTTVDAFGNFTTPKAVTEVEIGLPFDAFIVPLVQQVQMPDGITWGEPRRICSVTASLLESIGGDIDGERLPFDNATHDPGIAPDRWTGLYKSWRLGWDPHEAPVIRQAKPLPFHLRALGMEVEI